MVQGISSTAIAALHDVSISAEDKLRIVKTLKNIIVGQDQRKVLAVRSGIIAPLAEIIASHPQAKTTDSHSHRLIVDDVQLESPLDELCEQAVLIISTLAAGGHVFLRPLCAANIPAILVNTLSAGISSRLALAVLKAIKELASVWELRALSDQDQDLWKTLFSPQILQVFEFILREQRTPQGKQQLSLVAEIIALVPPSQSSIKTLLAGSGLLDTLSALLVSSTVVNSISSYPGDASQLLPPPPLSAVPSLLAAISTIVHGSIYIAHRFLLSPPLQELFGHAVPEHDDVEDSRIYLGPRYGFESKVNRSLLPPLRIPADCPASQRRLDSANFPASKLMQLPESRPSRPKDVASMGSDVHHINAVCGWLLVLARSWTGINRLAALRLLALLVNAVELDFASHSRDSDIFQKSDEREKQLALLAVPLAVKLVQTAGDRRAADTMQEQQELRSVQEQACVVLALLIRGSKQLQMAAFHADAIKYIAVVLRRSFDSVPPSKGMWTYKKDDLHVASLSNSCQLGTSSIPAEVQHAMECRRGALMAIEAMTTMEDELRKAVTNQGIIGCIIDSLGAFPPNAFNTEAPLANLPTARDGNTPPVLIAGCRALQSLSRSVSALRTSLLDGGLAKPVIELLRHPLLEVQIAATDVCCNLLPEFSPMRDEIWEASADTLIANARGTSPDLTFSTLWALKLFISKSSKDVRITTIKKLGPDWLFSIIQGEPLTAQDTPGAPTNPGLSTPNAAGQQVDLLNPPTMDIDDPPPSSPLPKDDHSDGEILYDESSSTHYQASQLRSTLHPRFTPPQYLSEIHDMEHSTTYIAQRDSFRIQQQAIDVLRNFLYDSDRAALTDFFLQHIDLRLLLDMLTTKLSPLPRAFVRGRASIHFPTEIVHSAIHLLNHLANATKCVAAIIAHKPLLQVLLPHFHHEDPSVRTVCVWLVIALTWVADDADRKDARQRVRELRALGVENALRALQHDPHLDVRERVKTALEQIDALSPSS